MTLAPVAFSMLRSWVGESSPSKMRRSQRSASTIPLSSSILPVPRYKAASADGRACRTVPTTSAPAVFASSLSSSRDTSASVLAQPVALTAAVMASASVSVCRQVSRAQRTARSCCCSVMCSPYVTGPAGCGSTRSDACRGISGGTLPPTRSCRGDRTPPPAAGRLFQPPRP